jgi:hypothetical protein
MQKQAFRINITRHYTLEIFMVHRQHLHIIHIKEMRGVSLTPHD